MKDTGKKVILFLACMCLVYIKAKAQDGMPGDPDVPFDGLSIALIAGVGYGAKKLMKKKNDNNTKKQEEHIQK
jgi:hypothetical protein